MPSTAAASGAVSSSTSRRIKRLAIRLCQGLDGAREVVPEPGRHGRRLQASSRTGDASGTLQPRSLRHSRATTRNSQAATADGGAQRADTAVQRPERVLDRILRVLRAAAGPARHAAQVRPGLGQQLLDRSRFAALGRLDQLTICPCRHLADPPTP